MKPTFITSVRYMTIVWIVLGAFCLLFGRLVYLHVWEKERLGRIIERNRQKFEVLEASRGHIVDAKGNLLATTREIIELGVDPQLVQEDDLKKLPQLSRLLHLPIEQLRLAFSTKTFTLEGIDGEEVRLIRWKKLADKIDESTYQSIQKLGIKAIYGNRKFERIYPGGALAAHVLGFVNKEGISCDGVEAFMDFYLRGQHGWRESERDGCRRELAHLRSREVLPKHGLNVGLSIDIMVQYAIEQVLAQAVDQYKPDSATIIVSDPSTGFILGLANVPTYDPNQFFNYPIDSHRNRAVTDLFEPGSTFKIVPAAGALNEGLVSLSHVVDCSLAQVEYKGRKLNLPKDHRPMDHLTVEQIITKSSNRGVAYLGMQLGAESLYHYAKHFGFGEPTGYGLSAEAKGILHSPKSWDALTITRLPMGHAVCATPIQVHYAMSVIANQGVLMQPQVVEKVFDDGGELVVQFQPKAKRRVISTTLAHTLSDVLTKVVGPEGTSKRAAIPEFEVAGKSGTSQKIIHGQYSHDSHVASFSGFFPASRPRFVVTVVVDNPKLKGCGYGSQVAAPLFKQVAEQLIRYYGLVPPASRQSLVTLKNRKNPYDRIW